MGRSIEGWHKMLDSVSHKVSQLYASRSPQQTLKWPMPLSSHWRIFQFHKSRFKMLVLILLFLPMYLFVTLPTNQARGLPDLRLPIYFNTKGHLPHIPPFIWQVYLDHSAAKMADFMSYIHSWVSNSPSHNYALLDSEGANAIMALLQAKPGRAHEKIANTYYSMEMPVMRGDIMRYLILALEGGVYSDIDTELVTPIQEWVPQKFRSQTRLIIGIEFDSRDKGDWGIEEEIQFCQWTIAAAPGHPVLWAMLDSIVEQVEKISRERRQPKNTLNFTQDEILKTTGPTAWTNIVFRQMSTDLGTTIDWRNITGLHEPRLYGDILVMPINAFGAGQEHSGSDRSATSEDILVKHHFLGSWKPNWRAAAY